MKNLIAKLKHSDNRIIKNGNQWLVALTNTISQTANQVLKGLSSQTMASKSYRYLAQQIVRDLPYDKGGRSIVFSSLSNLEINSEILLMMAHFLQNEIGCRVLLVDATFKHNGISYFLDMDHQDGFINLIYGENSDLDKTIVRLEANQVSLIPSGQYPTNTLPHVSYIKVENLITALNQQYDYVFYQQGSIKSDTRYIPFAKILDIVILHVEERTTPMSELEVAKDIFKEQHIGTVKYILSES